MILLWRTASATTKREGPTTVSPNPAKTPLGMHTVGAKCTACHTNQKAEGMGWFTGFNGLEHGFHDSQGSAEAFIHTAAFVLSQSPTRS